MSNTLHTRNLNRNIKNNLNLYILTVITLTVASVFGQGTNLSVEQQRLSFLKGSWTIDGSELVYIETCDWIEGNHIQCIATSKENKADYSISYFTYSDSEQVYIYYGLYGSGKSRTLRGKWIDDKFVFEGHRQTSDKLTRWRVTMKPNNGNIDFMEERSANDGDWQESVSFQYKPAPEQ